MVVIMCIHSLDLHCLRYIFMLLSLCRTRVSFCTVFLLFLEFKCNDSINAAHVCFMVKRT